MKFTLVDTKTFGKTTDDSFFQSPTTELSIDVNPYEHHPTLVVQPDKTDLLNKELTEVEILKNFAQKFSGTPVAHIYSKVLPSTTTELKYDSWTLLSVEELVKRSNLYNNKFYDIGITYAGMGHVIVLCYEPENQMFFFHIDGGSNGYERQDTHDKYLADAYDPSMFLCVNPKMTFTSQFDVLVPYTKVENSLKQFTGYY